MKNIFILIACLISGNLFAQQSPWGTFVPATDAKFKIFEGVAFINSNPLEVGDYIGALDANNRLVGVVQIENLVAGQALFHLEIFERSATDNSVNGIDDGDFYDLQFYDSSEGVTYEAGNFGPWTAADMNGTLADGDDETIYNTSEVALPIELVRFTGKSTTAGNVLFWTTATEKNNAHFVLEKSADGEQFTAFAQVKGAGDSEQVQQYQYIDQQPFAERTFYRLQSVNQSGEQEASKVIVVESAKLEQAAVAIFPNPATASVTIQLANNLQINQLRIFDVTGKTVLARTIAADEVNVQLAVENWTAGIYFIQLRGATGQWTELLSVK